MFPDYTLMYFVHGLTNFITLVGNVKFHEEWVLGSLSLVGEGIKQPGLEAESPLPSSLEVKNEWSCTSNPPVYLHGMYSRDFTLCEGECTVFWMY